MIALLGRRFALELDAVILPQRHARDHGETDDERCHAQHFEEVAAEEFRGVVAPVALARPDRHARQMMLDVQSQGFHGRIAPVGLLAHGHRHDGVQVAAQPRTQPRRREAAAVCVAVAQEVVLAAQSADRRLARLDGLVHADGAFQLKLAVAQQPVRRPARHELIQQNAERIDIGRGRDRPAEDLFGRRILRRQHAFLKARHRHGMQQTLGSEQLRDPEVEQLGSAIAGDEDVAGFDVAVHHEVAMRVLHGAAHLQEQFQPLAQEKSAIVAVGVHGLPVDVFHDEIGGAVVEVAAVDETRDRGVIERRENVPLAVQPTAQPRMQGRMMQHLDRHGLLVLLVVALAAIHRAHAPVAEDRHDPVGSYARAEQPVLMVFQQRFGCRTHGVHQRIFGPPIRLQQRFDRVAQFCIVPARSGQAGGPVLRRKIGYGLEQRLNLSPARGRDHGAGPEPISLSSQARARRMSRWTVAAEVPTASAIWS